MDYTKVIIGFGTGLYFDWDFVGKATLIVESMTDNPHFVLPKPTLEEVSTAIGAYDQSLNKAEDGSREDTVIKNNNRKVVERILRDSNSSGYELIKFKAAGAECAIRTS